MPRPVTLLSLVLLASGCASNLLSGDVDGHPFDVVEAVHFELRGIDQGTSLPFHDLTVWLMPVADSCAVWPALISDLTVLRSQLVGGQDPNEFCAEWVARWDDFLEGAPFFVSQLRLQAEPRGDDVTPDTTYAWLDSAGPVAPAAPWFDATFAWHEAPDAAACAAVFAGADHVPTHFEALGGEVTATSYTVDDAIGGEITVEIESRGDPVAGRFASTFCPGAGDWPVDAPLRL